MSFGSRSLPKPTAAQERRFTEITHGNCVACEQVGEFSYPEINHVVRANRRVGHDATYGLCSWHHRAVPSQGLSPKQMRERYGVSLADSKPRFYAQFGTDIELIEKQNQLMGVE